MDNEDRIEHLEGLCRELQKRLMDMEILLEKVAEEAQQALRLAHRNQKSFNNF